MVYEKKGMLVCLIPGCVVVNTFSAAAQEEIVIVFGDGYPACDTSQSEFLQQLEERYLREIFQATMKFVD